MSHEVNPKTLMRLISLTWVKRRRSHIKLSECSPYVIYCLACSLSQEGKP